MGVFWKRVGGEERGKRATTKKEGCFCDVSCMAISNEGFNIARLQRGDLIFFFFLTTLNECLFISKFIYIGSLIWLIVIYVINRYRASKLRRSLIYVSQNNFYLYRFQLLK